MGDVDNDGLPDLYFTSPSGGNRLFRNLGDCRFEDVTSASGLADTAHWGTGAAFADIDNDGDLDIFACGYLSENKCYINQGDGTFVNESTNRGLAFTGASVMMSWADYDRDGDLDGYLVTAGIPPGPEQKFRVRFEGDKPVIPEDLVEYWRMFYLPGKRAKQVEAGQFDKLYRNQGNGQFEEVTLDAGIRGADIGQSVTWWDYNNDLWPDIYVANDYWGEDYLWHNNGDGTFRNVNTNALPHTPWSSMGADFGDINNDGFLDFMATDMSPSSHHRQKLTMGDMSDSGWFLEFPEPRQYMRNTFFLNTGTDRFMELAQMLGVESTDWTWANRFADFDNDGLLDLFVANGVARDFMNTDLNQAITNRFAEGTDAFFAEWMKQSPREDRNHAFRNRGNLTFEPTAAAWGLDLLGVSYGAATGDLDQDGDLDLVVNNAFQPAVVYRNGSTKNHTVTIRLEGTRSNRDGLGVRIELETGSETQVRYTSNARGWMSTSEPLIHFGLHDANTIDHLRVSWPSGHVQAFADLPAGHHYHIVEPYAKPPKDPSASQEKATGLFAHHPGTEVIQHEEAPFDDFASQPLLPFKQSQRGPGLACADIDGDGDDDLYLGGGGGFPGQLYANEQGRLNRSRQPAFRKDTPSEDQAALFFDADGDADPDLFVVSGSNEFPEKDPRLRDRLYLNDGSGSFELKTSALPDLLLNGSAAAAADVDRDGDLDLFVGSHARPGAYPQAQPSYLLRNQAGQFEAEAVVTGLVNSAIWTDLDQDGWIDLLVAAEWDPIRYFKNEQGKLVEHTREAGLTARRGWWNSITSADIDADGDLDLVAGNLGLNTKYHAPVKIYFGDFEGVGDQHIVEAGLKDNKWLPVRGKSCSQNAMPWIRERFPTYGSFSLATLQDIYTPEKLETAGERSADTLESGIWLNDGQQQFTFQALPRVAQAAPVFGIATGYVNADRHLDLYLVQNAYHPQRETGRFDGGVSQLLLGLGDGQFDAVPPQSSSLVVPGDATAVVTTDLNGDQQPDYVVAQNQDRLFAFTARKSVPRLALRLDQPGCLVRAVYPGEAAILLETRAGESYLSQSGSRYWIPAGAESLHVRWPDGQTSDHQVDADRPVTVLKPPQS